MNMTILSKRLVYLAISFLPYSVANAEIPFDEYSWVTVEALSHDVETAQKSIQSCLSDAKKNDNCIGITVQSCVAPKPQCYYLEAAGWELIGYRLFNQIARDLPALNILKQSQNTWIQFAQAECALTASVHRIDPVLRRHEGARCVLVLTATRTLMLHAHVSNINGP